MRKVAVLLALVAGAALAFESAVATLTSSGSSVSWTDPTKGEHLTIQCNADAYVTVGSGSATASSTTGVRVSGNAPPYDIYLSGSVDTVAEIPVSGTNSCTLFHSYP